MGALPPLSTSTRAEGASGGAGDVPAMDDFSVSANNSTSMNAHARQTHFRIGRTMMQTTGECGRSKSAWRRYHSPPVAVINRLRDIHHWRIAILDARDRLLSRGPHRDGAQTPPRSYAPMPLSAREVPPPPHECVPTADTSSRHARAHSANERLVPSSLIPARHVRQRLLSHSAPALRRTTPPRPPSAWSPNTGPAGKPGAPSNVPGPTPSSTSCMSAASRCMRGRASSTPAPIEASSKNSVPEGSGRHGRRADAGAEVQRA